MKVVLPVFDGGKIERREYSGLTVDAVGKTTEEAVLYIFYYHVVIDSPALPVCVRVLAEPNPVLPYAYFRFRDLEYYTTEQSFSTGMRRLMELVDLAAAVARMEALEPSTHVL